MGSVWHPYSLHAFNKLSLQYAHTSTWISQRIVKAANLFHSMRHPYQLSIIFMPIEFCMNWNSNLVGRTGQFPDHRKLLSLWRGLFRSGCVHDFHNTYQTNAGCQPFCDFAAPPERLPSIEIHLHGINNMHDWNSRMRMQRTQWPPGCQWRLIDNRCAL